jgi:peptidoglycan hydrolase CwlO-like protein
MALYAFETPALLYFGLGFIAAVPLVLMLMSFEWVARLVQRSGQRDVRRLAQLTAEMNRNLGDRDRLHAEHALTRQQLEASKAAAAHEISALQQRLEKREAMLERLKLRMKEQTAAQKAADTAAVTAAKMAAKMAAKTAAQRKVRTARGGSRKSAPVRSAPRTWREPDSAAAALQ